MLLVVLDAAVRSALVLVVVLLALKTVRVRNPHILMAAWQMVLAASLSMPLLVALVQHAMPSHRLPLPESLVTDFATVVAQVPVAPVPAAPASVAQATPTIPAHVETMSLDWLGLASWLYLLVAGSLVLRWLVGYVLMWRLCRAATPVCEDWADGRDVRSHPAIAVPATFGSTILLPRTHSEWDATQRRAALAHEHAHVRRGDFYVLAFASLNRAVFWISPAAWWLHKRIADLAEARSDAAAIEEIGDRVRYVEILVDFAGGGTRSVVALSMARSRTVRHRVERILGESIMPRVMDWKTWAALVASILLLAIAAGTVVAQGPSEGPVVAEPDPKTQRLERSKQLLENAMRLVEESKQRLEEEERRLDAVVAPDPTAKKRLEESKQRLAESKQRLEKSKQRLDEAMRGLEQRRARKEVYIDPKILDNYVGYYQLDPLKVVTIARLGDQLHAKITGQSFRRLYPESAQKFFHRGSNVPVQISFSVDAQGAATGLTRHRRGTGQHAKRIEEADAKSAEEAFAKRLKEPTPQSGSEAALRRQIGAFQQGQPAYHEMSEDLASIFRPQLLRIQRRLGKLGALQSISFRGVGAEGRDVYEAKFENGLAICRIYMAQDGKVERLRFEWGP